jgi:hypothetical protein
LKEVFFKYQIRKKTEYEKKSLQIPLKDIDHHDAFLVQSCNKGKAPEWAAINKQIINDFKSRGASARIYPRTG